MEKASFCAEDEYRLEDCGELKELTACTLWWHMAKHRLSELTPSSLERTVECSLSSRGPMNMGERICG